MKELADLHRGLAFDAEESPDAKRTKTIAKVLRKIDEVLGEDEGEDVGEMRPMHLGAPLIGGTPGVIDLPGMNGSPESSLATARCRVMLTRKQRDLICSMETISLDVQKMLNVESSKECEFEWSPRQTMVVSFALAEVVEQCPSEGSAKAYVDIIERINEGVGKAMDETAEMGAAMGYHESQSDPEVAYQLKITLDGSKPPIWRRLVVGDCILAVLHQIIQSAMGWTNSHLHMFEYGKQQFSDPRFELDGIECDEADVWLSGLADAGCKKLRYWYDFGDDWRHTITIEKELLPKQGEKFPRCVKGAGACPPEDCGGIWGYYDLLDAIHDPEHERHAELVEWLPDGFDPERFELKETNKLLALGPDGGFADE